MKGDRVPLPSSRPPLQVPTSGDGVFLSSVYPRRRQVTTPAQRLGAPHRGKAPFPEQSHCRRRHGQALSLTSRAAAPRATADRCCGQPRGSLCARALFLRLPPPRTPWELGPHAQQAHVAAHVAARTMPSRDARGTGSMPPGTGPLWKPAVRRAPLASEWL